MLTRYLLLLLIASSMISGSAQAGMMLRDMSDSVKSDEAAVCVFVARFESQDEQQVWERQSGSQTGMCGLDDDGASVVVVAVAGSPSGRLLDRAVTRAEFAKRLAHPCRIAMSVLKVPI